MPDVKEDGEGDGVIYYRIDLFNSLPKIMLTVKF